MTTVVTRMFDNYDQARQAVQDLEASGVPHDNISLVASNADNRYGTGTVADTTAGTTAGAYTTGTYAEPVTAPGAPVGTTALGDEPAATDAESTGAGTGATIGTILGGGAGLLAGLGLLAIPGVGPIVAAGWLIATLTGAGIGAAGGGILGGLVGAGVPEEEAHVYAEGVRRGGTLITVRADDSQRGMVEQILDRYSPVDVNTRAAEYRAGGWSRFDENAPAYSAGSSAAMGTDTTTGMADTTGTAGPRTTSTSRL